MQEGTHVKMKGTDKIPVILDTDANNELDDQHAIAYMLLSGDVFDVKGITVNRTASGGDVIKHLEEAERIVKLCGLHQSIEVYKGANGAFDEIKDSVNESAFDGADAVNFILEKSNQTDTGRLLLLAVGKLTNIALALKKDPSIASQVRIVWLGSNYPDPGEYNQENDPASLSYILDTDVDFEIALVRYNKPSGTAAVTVSLNDIREKMAGKGPAIPEPIVGRHGGKFACFGDYSISLFENAEFHGMQHSRALFDMAAVAIVKNASWATPTKIPAPTLVDGNWVDRPGNQRKIVIWENFDREKIIQDFYDRMDNYQPVKAPANDN
jgi:inosine-uridine nucleoside N-ribohydrolase